MFRVWIGALALVIVLAALAIPASSEWDSMPQDTKGELRIIHAGSLSIPFRDISDMFIETYPGVKVLLEAHGSRDCARKVRELGLDYDIMGSADFSVIDNLLRPDFAQYSIRFATNEMAIAYTEHSAFADEINADNWCEVLLREGVNIGRADPNRDPCGYRCVMTCQLAELHYKQPGLADALLSKHEGKYIRPKETDLLALLEVGEIDYLFIYRSVAEQHNLYRLLLPDEVNLKSAELSDLYSRATVQLVGKEPGELTTKSGAPMVYGVTIPATCTNYELATAWVELLLSAEGQAIMRLNGQPPIVPAICEQYSILPGQFKRLCKPQKEE